MNVEKIEKLKILKINQKNIIVQNNKNQKGIVYISNISNSYIVSLDSLFNVNDVVYGYLLKVEGYRRFYSLKYKHGHTKRGKPVSEIGGGPLGVFYLLERQRLKLENE